MIRIKARIVKWAGMALFILLLVLGLVIQSWRASHYSAKSGEYIKLIEQYDQAVRLTDQLREDNAELIRERNDLLEGIQDVEGYDMPIPDDLRGIIDRVQQGAGSSPEGDS